MGDDGLVKFEMRGGVAVLTLDDPHHLNALGSEMAEHLLAAVQRVADEGRARALALRGAGRAFCAGANLSEIEKLFDGEPQVTGDFIGDLMQQVGNPIVAALRALPMPTLAVVHGVAAGGGVGLALAADIVVAARSAYFYLPFVPSLALIPDLGATWTLTHGMGRARALGLALTGDRLTAEQAEQWGLIWKCLPDEDFELRSLELAQRLAALPGEAVKSARDLIDGGAVKSFADQIAMEAQAQRQLAAKAAFRRGVEAFVAKRKPRFD